MLLEHALAYAARGWMVFPIRPGGKFPATKNGFLDASRDRDVIEKWWTGQAVERRNIGIVTSRASGIWVLDCDVDAETGEFGEDTLADLCAQNGPLPRSPMQVTPGGGKHYFFAWPADGEDIPRRIRFAPGLDALGSRIEDGVEKAGYLIIAPSVRLDGEYRWIVSPDECDLPQAPDWLIAMVREGRKERPADLPRIAPVRAESTTPYGRKALMELCAEISACPPGSQDQNLMSRATRIGSLAAGGAIDMDEAFQSTVAAGMAMSNQSGREPWTMRDVQKKVRRAFEYAARDPTAVPESRGRRGIPIDREEGPIAPSPPVEAYEDEGGVATEKSPERPKPQLIVSNPEKPKPDRKRQEGQAAWTSLPKNQWMRDHEWIWKDEDSLKPSSLRNLQLMIEFHPDLKGMFSYNVFADQVIVNRGLPDDTRDDYPRELRDQDATAVAAWMNWHGLTPAIGTTRDVIAEVAFRMAFDPLLDWVNSLRWDGKPRIDTWLTYYAGADDSEYVRLVGRKFLISAIARAMQPGSKVDTMLVLEGPQGLKKSTLVRVLAGSEWFSDQVGDVTNKDASQMIQGIWIMEIPEMDKFSRAESNAVKDFLARLFDRYRPPYGHNAIKRERRTVFFGTINPDGVGYLKDTTGNRRYWPVTVRAIDLDGIREDREQLWAEARAAYEAKESWWVDDDRADIVVPEQDARRDDDVWEPKIRSWLDDPVRMQMERNFTSSDVLSKVIGLELKQQKQSEKIRVAKILKMMGARERNNANGIRGRSWEHGGTPE